MDDWNSQRRIDLQKIILSESDREILREHAERERPYESCAILFGRDSRVLDVFLTENTERSSANFTISNEQLIEGYKIAEGKKMEMIGIFHSHPDSEAYPSSTDKRFMHSNPVAWIIYSGINKDFKAYFLGLDIIEIPIECG